MREKTATFDEPAHLPAGYSYLLTNDFRMNPEHPPLTKIISAIPLLFLKLKHPAQLKNWQGKNSFVFGKEFLYYSHQDADRILFLGRIPMVLISIALGLLVFLWAKEMFSFKAGLFSLFLYCLSPNIIAHSQLVTPDIGVCFFITLSAYFLWKYLNKPTKLKLVLLGIALGCSLISKFNSLILVPIFLILIIIYQPKRALSTLSMMLILVFFIIWAAYGFETGKILEKESTHPTINQLTKDYPKSLQNMVYLFGNISLPFPSYFKGLGFLLYTNINKHESFLMGKHFRGSSILGFLIAFIIKTPIAFLIFLFLSILLVIKNKVFLDKNQIFLWVLPLIIFLTTGLFSLSLHLKYVLAVYPFLCIFMGQIANSKFFHLPSFRLFVWGLCIWYVLGTLHIYPHYLAYFNEFVGGPKNGYKYLVDSNLDWGQDLKLLKRYLDKHNIKEIRLAYFGTADPAYYQINYKNLEPFEYTTSWVAISATYLQGVHTVKGGYDWLKRYEPKAQIGYSIFLYNLEKK